MSLVGGCGLQGSISNLLLEMTDLRDLSVLFTTSRSNVLFSIRSSPRFGREGIEQGMAQKSKTSGLFLDGLL